MFRDDSFFDHAVRLLILTIGAAETAHIVGLYGYGIRECTILFGGLLAVLFLAYFFTCTAGKRLQKKKGSFVPKQKKHFDREEKWLVGIVVLIWLVMLGMILCGRFLYRAGDMTLETVETFLDGNVYWKNPMTGHDYREGLPIRVAILCLPSLYSYATMATGFAPWIVVYKLIPVGILFLSFCAFGALGKALFENERKKQLLFLLAVGLVLLGGIYAPYMDGFGLICSGFRASTIRNLVLVPYTMALCCRRKSLLAIFTVLAEACIAWTLYGAGVCFLIAAVWTVCTILSRGKLGKGGQA